MSTRDTMAPAVSLSVIEPQRPWRTADLRELWDYRELLCFLAWRDVKVRYRETLLGGLWAILQPVAMMVAFSLFFGRVAQVQSVGMPYPLFVLAGLLPWTFFANALTAASQSVVANQALVTKVYFPRVFLPFAAVGVGLVDFVVAFGVLIAAMAFYGVLPASNVVMLPIILGALVMCAVGIGTLLSGLTTAYRDFRYVVPFLVQLWLFFTPSVYMPVTAVSGGAWTAMTIVNPPLGLIGSFRNAVLGGAINTTELAVSCAASAAVFAIGCGYFRRVELNFADVI